MEELKINYKDELLEAIQKKDYKKIRDLFENVPNIDIADSCNEIDEDDENSLRTLVLVFKIVKPTYTSDFFSDLSPELQEKIINLLSNEEIGDLVEEISNDELADFIEEMPANIVDKILKNSSVEQRQILNKLLGYRDDSAGTIMTTEYITLIDYDTVENALKTIRKVGKGAETIYTLFVRNKKFDLVGVLNLDDLIFADPSSILSDVCDTTFQVVNVNTDQEEVAKIFKRYDLNAIGVVNEDNKLTGIITIDDIVDVIEEETSEDIEVMASVSPLKNSYMDTPIFRLALKCIPWLLVLMVLNIGSIAIQNQFQWLVGNLTVIAVFLTTICGTGGNSGTQSSTLMIRGLATGDFEIKDYGKVILKELCVSLLVGIIVSIVAFVYCMILFAVKIVVIPDAFVANNANGMNLTSIWLVFSGIVSITLFITIIISKFLGASLPFLISKMKLDPAVVTSPLISTIMDLTTLAIYFGLIFLSFFIFSWI